MKRIYHSILTAVLLLAAVGCSDSETAQLQTGEAVFDVQSRAEGDKQLVRLFLAERMPEHEDGPGHNDEPLHCDPMQRFTLKTNPYTVSRPLYEQWYKFAFVAVPSEVVWADMGVNMFVPEKPLGVYEQEHKFNKLMVDYAPVLEYQTTSLDGDEDLAIYRKIIDRWVESGKTLSEKVTLTRSTGELVLDMGIPVDQFKKTVSQIALTVPDVHTRMYIRDGGNDTVYLDETNTRKDYTFAWTVAEADRTVKQERKIALLPQELTSATLTVTFTDDTSKEYQLVNTAGKPISVKKNTRTTVRFNGIPTEEFEIRYAGFNEAATIAVDEDRWDGWGSSEGATLEGGETRGTYIIDYAPEEVTRARGISDNLNANQRISSLTYLLYNGGRLIKRREIPDIGEGTTWPLKRATMTWEQREALKDTLEAGRTYQVMFVANALAGWGTSPLVDVDDYETASLKMPQGTFANNNMFYLFKGEVASGGGYNRDTPCDYPVVLERVVACTDFVRQTLPDDKKGHLLSVNPNLITSLDEGVKEAIRTSLKEFVEDLSDYFNQNEATEAYVSNCTTLIENIQKSDAVFHTQVFEAEKEAVQGELWTSCLSNAKVTEKWNQSWDGKVAQLNFDSNLGVEKLWLKDWTSVAGVATSVSLPVEKIGGKDGFTWVGFGQGGVADANRIGSITFYEADGTTTAFTIADGLQTNQAGNTRVKATYVPFKSISSVASYVSENYIINYNLETLLFSDADADFVSAVKEALNTNQTLFDAYGTNLQSITLSIKIPDLGNKDNLLIKSGWETE